MSMPVIPRWLQRSLVALTMFVTALATTVSAQAQYYPYAGYGYPYGSPYGYCDPYNPYGCPASYGYGYGGYGYGYPYYANAYPYLGAAALGFGLGFGGFRHHGFFRGGGFRSGFHGGFRHR